MTSIEVNNPLPTPPDTRALAASANRINDASQAIAESSGWGFLEFFMLGQVLLPGLLYLPGTQALRVPIRVAPFALALAGIGFLLASRRRVRPHNAVTLLHIILGYLACMILLPTTNTFFSGAAQVTLYLAVMSPIFWAPSLVRSRKQVQRLMVILLCCNGLNAIVAILQVYNPDVFMPKQLSTIVTEQLDAIPWYTDADGQVQIRPTGLSDNPGSVCAPASIAALLGLIFVFQPIKWWWRAGAGALAFAGIAAIFLSHVRTSILILAGMWIVFSVMLWLQGKHTKSLTFVGVGAGLLASALLFAVMMVGDSIVERFGSLLDDSPVNVYYKAGRGSQLQYGTAQYLTEYPLGAGLARWGMMRVYFGDERNPDSPPLWSELQWTAWALDGGFVLFILYHIVLIRNTWYEYTTCRRFERSAMSEYMVMIFAANMGVMALVFGFTPFTTQIGVQYWFLAGLLHGVTQLPRSELV